MDCRVGEGIFSDKLKVSKSFRLPDSVSVFQEGLLAILEACRILNNFPIINRNYAIFSDSQAAVKVIDSATTSSKLLEKYRKELSKLCVQSKITIIWVPGHSNFEGNERADELARQGSALSGSLAERVNIPLGVVKGNIHHYFLKLANFGWNRLST